MFSSLIVVAAAAALASSSNKMALAQCPCSPLDSSGSYMQCEDPSLTSIPDCVPSNISILSIRTPSIPLVADTIRRFTNLAELYVGRFDDPQVSKSFLSSQPNITTFRIHHTSLDYVDNEWLIYTPRITALYFNYNKIASLAWDTFSSVPLLHTVFLHNNELTTLSVSHFEGTSLKKLYIANNPWHCDCELATFMQWTRDHGVTFGDEPTCLHPSELEGRKLIYLTLDLACKK